MFRSVVAAVVLSIGAAVAAEGDAWTGKSVTFAQNVKLGRRFGGGLVLGEAAVDKSKTYVVKSDDGTFLELVGETGLVFKSDARVVAPPAKPDPVVGTYKWYTGAEFVFRAGGTATAKLDGKKWSVRWVVNPYGGYVLMYDGGGVDVVKLGKDGKTLEETGVSEGKAYPVGGLRQ